MLIVNEMIENVNEIEIENENENELVNRIDVN